jgi:hypothetical protein
MAENVPDGVVRPVLRPIVRNVLRDVVGAPEAAAVSTPDQIFDSLSIWYRGDNYAPGTWTDESGNTNNATQGTAGFQPASESGPNGHSAVRFDGSNDQLAIASFPAGLAGTGGKTYWCVFRGDTGGIGEGVLTLGAAGAGQAFAILNQATLQLNFSSYSLTFDEDLNDATTFYSLIIVVPDSANALDVDVYLNGVAIAPSASSDGPLDLGTTSKIIGAYIGFLDGDFAELGATASAATAEQVAALAAYLADEYAL